jgi:hypothetical protein
MSCKSKRLVKAMLVATGLGGCTLAAVHGRFLTTFLVFGVVSCTTPEPRDGPRPSITAEPQSKGDLWKDIATPADQDRLAKLGLAWQEALHEAQPSFHREIDAEGVLLRPRAALARPAPTPGSYNCRLIKLGKATAKAVAFERFKPFFCYVEVEGELLTIVKQTGSQRPAGRLWEDERPDRLVYLGSLALGDEQQPMAYNEDAKRDMAGVVERVGPFKWRLVIPWPQSTSKLDVFELTPVAQQPGT